MSSIATTTSPSDTTSAAVPTGTDRGRGRRIVTGVVAAVAGAAIVGGLAFGLGSHAATSAAPAPAASSSSVVVPAATGSNAGHHVSPSVRPSASIETLQRELGQLNDYEGPVDGIMNQQTIQAITYLQRDAHLPQTGRMNAATQAALADFLAHDNNVMGG